MQLTITELMEVECDRSPYLMAATSLGPFVSADAGMTWQPLGTLQNTVTFTIGACAKPDGGEMVFAGTVGGLIGSLDRGCSWQSLLTSSPVTVMATGRDRHGEMVSLIGTESDGCFRSTNLGETWSSASPGLLDYEILALQLSPTFARDNTVLAGTASGLYRSRNGGLAWRPLRLPEDDCPVVSVAFHPRFDNCPLLWAGTEVSGLLRSSDGGTTWTIDQHIGRQGVSSIVVSKNNPASIFIAADDGIYRSENMGESWTLVNPMQDVLCLKISDRYEREFLLAGLANNGVMRSIDSGTTWEPAEIVCPG